jgi:hypothetical protein
MNFKQVDVPSDNHSRLNFFLIIYQLVLVEENTDSCISSFITYFIAIITMPLRRDIRL